MPSLRTRRCRLTTTAGIRRKRVCKRATWSFLKASTLSAIRVTATVSITKPLRIARSLVTNAEWLAFMNDGGYANPALWLSDGWTAAQNEGWQAPGHWKKCEEGWRQLTLGG